MRFFKGYFRLSWQIWLAIGSWVVMASFYKGAVLNLNMDYALDVYKKCILIALAHGVVYRLFFFKKPKSEC
ncbi:hypothetical protein [Anaeromicrobium sediminis]|uniref:Uncharacterized protein n=1 Tax=Anaeromicrobium sediminis TaxID=1478221 RepID=A0A267MP97_9FIRM|nr:hypothetical protein [Anaeromicrobium sediminis]PAB60550.1 hypothetical protein CCE28_03125 [Anaeromicrobium sediminis]